jgi:hypothetical protein
MTLCGSAAAQAGLTIKVGDVSAGHRQSTEVPIEVAGASNVGSMHLELVYDPAVLEPLEVNLGALASGAFPESNLDTPGRIVIGLISADGITGSGQVAVVTFDVPGHDGDTSSLSLENVTAHDADTLGAIQTAVQSGTFSVGAAAGAGTTTLLIGVFAVILVAAVAIIWMVTRSRQVVPPAGPAVRRGGQLVVSRGQASQSSLSLDRPVITLGRESTNDLVLLDDLASRQHAQIRRQPEGLVIYDMNSTNGTFVNGERVAQHLLRPGDVIAVGDTELLFQG